MVEVKPEAGHEFTGHCNHKEPELFQIGEIHLGNPDDIAGNNEYERILLQLERIEIQVKTEMTLEAEYGYITVKTAGIAEHLQGFVIPEVGNEKVIPQTCHGFSGKESLQLADIQGLHKIFHSLVNSIFYKNIQK